MSWDVVKFGDLYAIPSRNGLMRPSRERGNGFKMINMGELFAYPRIMNPEMERVQVSDNELQKYTVLDGDLLFARQSLVLEGAGKCSIVTTSEHPTVFESHLIRVRLNKELCDPYFYFYFFNSQWGLGFIQQIVNQVAAAGIRGSDLERMKIIHPPLPAQQKIAAILSAYDDLIENNNKRIALLEKAAEEIYREWFVRMRFPGWEKVKFVKGVPEGWGVKKIGDLVSTQYGYTTSAISEPIGPKFLRITDIAPSIINWDEVPHCSIEDSLQDKYFLHEGDVVVARTGATVGYAKRINKLHPASIFASYLVRLKPTNIDHSIFLGISVESKNFKDFINMFITGAAQPQANATIMSLFPLLLPTSDLIKEFNNLVEPILDSKEQFILKNSKLKQSRDLLLSRLVSGKLSVEGLDIRFPMGMEGGAES